MHLFLIRHGETEHNIAGLLAGVTDSRLTNHGVLQTQRLGSKLVKDRGLRFTDIYSSDLQRAYMTANEICKAQGSIGNPVQKIEVVKLEVLREQDFGSLELVSWSSRRAEKGLDQQTPNSSGSSFKPKETADSMKSRANTFIDDYIVPLLVLEHEQLVRIAVVSHGIFLSNMWRSLYSRFSPQTVTVSPYVAATVSGQPPEHISWSNTGCLEVNIQISTLKAARPIQEPVTAPLKTDDTSPFTNAKMTILSVNDKRHLLNLKRARGGIGSAAHDLRQQDLNTFFKKSKTGSTGPTDKG